MSTKVEATIEDLYKVEGKAELVNGEIVHMSPTGPDPHYAAWVSRILCELTGKLLKAVTQSSTTLDS